ncbi:MAG TPA: hypothetical protein PK668_18995 [Myxococcota bacterium]|nr:hypothetical protein [Myxococcota bacterium]HRY95182.1 hypothetical protein [Myxococcota bacterium]HSA20407.1 hypothetical protein [Myxococcota bacterium]
MDRPITPLLWLCVALLGLTGCGGSTAPGDGGPGDGDGGTPPECSQDGDCSGGGFCVAGQCVACRHAADCASGEVCQAGRCVTACPIGERCESGGTCCPEDWECVERVCRAPCDGSRCGHHREQCCGAGWLCEDERCLVDCGGDSRCGRSLDICCAAGELCYGFGCTRPLGHCATQSDCAPGQVCEVDLDVCLDEEVVGDCLYHPPVGVFQPEVEWVWSGSQVEPEFDQVMMAPVVANLTDDNGDGTVSWSDVPDVVFTSFHRGGDYNGRGVLRVLSGADGSEHLNLTGYSVHPGSCPAIGDLEADGVPEIVVDQALAGGQVAGTYAFRVDGTLVWQAPGTGCSTGGPAIADLDGDGRAEVITQTAVLQSDGSLACTFPEGAHVPAAADIDLDGFQEVLSGKGAYRLATGGGACPALWELPAGGSVAVADFDADPYPEIVFPVAGQLVVLEHDGGELWSAPIPLDQPRIEQLYGIADCAGSAEKACQPGGGPPTVADFDGDGEPEIGLAARWYYLVYDSDGAVLWAHKTQDFSSAVTGSSVFDFEGDGQAEVIYNDELYLRMYKGAGSSQDADGDGFLDPEILVEIANPSGTLLEYPLVVDVDADGRAEILVAANNYAFPGVTGLRVFGDALDNWVGTRRIWNQHSYHVTNLCDGVDPSCSAADNFHARVPAAEQRNWQLSWLNNYRQNVQGEGLFWAPDLTVINLHAVCELASLSLYITFDVMNQGSRQVGPGVAVSVYIDDTPVHTAHTTFALLPGHLEHFSLSWTLPAEMLGELFGLHVAADDAGDGVSRLNECEDGGEDNNRASLLDLSCDYED